MLPAVWPGDVLVIERAQLAQLGAGDIVLFARDDRLFAHRLLQVCGDGTNLVLGSRGDALPHNDPPLPVSQVLGRVHAVLRNGRPVRRLRPSAAQKVFAWALRHAGPAYFLLLRLHGWRRRWSGNSPDSELVRHAAKLDNPVISAKE